MIKLSVNINKFATLRNARGGNNPNVVKAAIDAQFFGADGVTVHPRPDERHITYNDVVDIKKVITTEFNIEGNPTEQKFVELVLKAKPHQVTLVPDALNQLTSNHGWNTIEHQAYLKKIIAVFKEAGIRVSIFIDPVEELIKAAATTGADRIELYTESYANWYIQVIQQKQVNTQAYTIDDYLHAATVAKSIGLGINAGHDLDLNNLGYFAKHIPFLDEVSIGHALICDAIYLGYENTIQLYKRQLNEF
jgi:pyridoxine 5-phosphate synthase